MATRLKSFVVALIAALIVVVAAPQLARAQRASVDSIRIGSTRGTLDSARAPITPRRAFFYSFLVPGYSQSVLGRHKAATLFMLVEAISIGMIRESAADAHEARRIANDSLVISYVDESGNAARVVGPPRFNDAYIHTREAHVEDWVALLVANHLFAGADAYVGASLWDVRARLGMRLLPRGTVVMASIKW
jgi:hypothetical protein